MAGRGDGSEVEAVARPDNRGSGHTADAHREQAAREMEPFPATRQEISDGERRQKDQAGEFRENGQPQSASEARQYFQPGVSIHLQKK